MRIPAIIAAALLSTTVVANEAVAAGVLSTAEATAALDDFGTRLQFAFYTADDRALQRDLTTLVAVEVPGELASLKHTYAGFGAWKHAELMRQTAAQQAVESARSCIKELEQAVALEPRRAGLLAMLSRCERLVTDLQGRGRSPMATSKARQYLERASGLAPMDPHVLVIEGVTEFERWRATGGELSTARAKFKAATSAFDASLSATTLDPFATAMGWGAAEAWCYLGQVEVELQDVVAARDAFERALVIVGDYREVQERLRSMTGQ